jgi:AcrR family transcriptional regulator
LTKKWKRSKIDKPNSTDKPMGRKKLLPNRADIILKAAAELFAELGYGKTTLDEIAERAAISKGSIYLEFESKEEILFAIIVQSQEEQLEEMRRLVSRRTVTQGPREALDTLKAMLVKNIGAVFDAVKRNRRSAEEILQSQARLRVRLAPFFEARLDLIEALLERAVKQGEIRPQKDFRRIAQLIMLSLRAVLPPYEPQASKLKLQNDAAEILELIFNGLCRHEPSSS